MSNSEITPCRVVLRKLSIEECSGETTYKGLEDGETEGKTKGESKKHHKIKERRKTRKKFSTYVSKHQVTSGQYVKDVNQKKCNKKTDKRLEEMAEGIKRKKDSEAHSMVNKKTKENILENISSSQLTHNKQPEEMNQEKRKITDTYLEKLEDVVEEKKNYEAHTVVNKKKKKNLRSNISLPQFTIGHHEKELYQEECSIAIDKLLEEIAEGIKRKKDSEAHSMVNKKTKENILQNISSSQLTDNKQPEEMNQEKRRIIDTYLEKLEDGIEEKKNSEAHTVVNKKKKKNLRSNISLPQVTSGHHVKELNQEECSITTDKCLEEMEEGIKRKRNSEAPITVNKKTKKSFPSNISLPQLTISQQVEENQEKYSITTDICLEEMEEEIKRKRNSEALRKINKKTKKILQSNVSLSQFTSGQHVKEINQKKCDRATDTRLEEIKEEIERKNNSEACHTVNKNIKKNIRSNVSLSQVTSGQRLKKLNQEESSGTTEKRLENVKEEIKRRRNSEGHITVNKKTWKNLRSYASMPQLTSEQQVKEMNQEKCSITTDVCLKEIAEIKRNSEAHSTVNKKTKKNLQSNVSLPQSSCEQHVEKLKQKECGGATDERLEEIKERIKGKSNSEAHSTVNNKLKKNLQLNILSQLTTQDPKEELNREDFSRTAGKGLEKIKETIREENFPSHHSINGSTQKILLSNISLSQQSVGIMCESFEELKTTPLCNILQGKLVPPQKYKRKIKRRIDSKSDCAYTPTKYYKRKVEMFRDFQERRASERIHRQSKEVKTCEIGSEMIARNNDIVGHLDKSPASKKQSLSLNQGVGCSEVPGTKQFPYCIGNLSNTSGIDLLNHNGNVPYNKSNNDGANLTPEALCSDEIHLIEGNHNAEEFLHENERITGYTTNKVVSISNDSLVQITYDDFSRNAICKVDGSFRKTLIESTDSSDKTIYNADRAAYSVDPLINNNEAYIGSYEHNAQEMPPCCLTKNSDEYNSLFSDVQDIKKTQPGKHKCKKCNIKKLVFKKLTKFDRQMLLYRAKVDKSFIPKFYCHCISSTSPSDSIFDLHKNKDDSQTMETMKLTSFKRNKTVDEKVYKQFRLKHSVKPSLIKSNKLFYKKLVKNYLKKVFCGKGKSRRQIVGAPKLETLENSENFPNEHIDCKKFEDVDLNFDDSKDCPILPYTSTNNVVMDMHLDKIESVDNDINTSNSFGRLKEETHSSDISLDIIPLNKNLQAKEEFSDPFVMAKKKMLPETVRLSKKSTFFMELKNLALAKNLDAIERAYSSNKPYYTRSCKLNCETKFEDGKCEIDTIDLGMESELSNLTRTSSIQVRKNSSNTPEIPIKNPKSTYKTSGLQLESMPKTNGSAIDFETESLKRLMGNLHASEEQFQIPVLTDEKYSNPKLNLKLSIETVKCNPENNNQTPDLGELIESIPNPLKRLEKNFPRPKKASNSKTKRRKTERVTVHNTSNKTSSKNTEHLKNKEKDFDTLNLTGNPICSTEQTVKDITKEVEDSACQSLEYPKRNFQKYKAMSKIYTLIHNSRNPDSNSQPQKSAEMLKCEKDVKSSTRDSEINCYDENFKTPKNVTTLKEILSCYQEVLKTEISMNQVNYDFENTEYFNINKFTPTINCSRLKSKCKTNSKDDFNIGLVRQTKANSFFLKNTSEKITCKSSLENEVSGKRLTKSKSLENINVCNHYKNKCTQVIPDTLNLACPSKKSKFLTGSNNYLKDNLDVAIEYPKIIKKLNSHFKCSINATNLEDRSENLDKQANSEVRIGNGECGAGKIETLDSLDSSNTEQTKSTTLSKSSHQGDNTLENVECKTNAQNLKLYSPRDELKTEFPKRTDTSIRISRSNHDETATQKKDLSIIYLKEFLKYLNVIDKLENNLFSETTKVNSNADAKCSASISKDDTFDKITAFEDGEMTVDTNEKTLMLLTRENTVKESPETTNLNNNKGSFPETTISTIAAHATSRYFEHNTASNIQTEKNKSYESKLKDAKYSSYETKSAINAGVLKENLNSLKYPHEIFSHENKIIESDKVENLEIQDTSALEVNDTFNQPLKRTDCLEVMDVDELKNSGQSKKKPVLINLIKEVTEKCESVKITLNDVNNGDNFRKLTNVEENKKESELPNTLKEMDRTLGNGEFSSDSSLKSTLEKDHLGRLSNFQILHGDRFDQTSSNSLKMTFKKKNTVWSSKCPVFSPSDNYSECNETILKKKDNINSKPVSSRTSIKLNAKQGYAYSSEIETRLYNEWNSLKIAKRNRKKKKKMQDVKTGVSTLNLSAKKLFRKYSTECHDFQRIESPNYVVSKSDARRNNICFKSQDTHSKINTTAVNGNNSISESNFRLIEPQVQSSTEATTAKKQHGVCVSNDTLGNKELEDNENEIPKNTGAEIKNVGAVFNTMLVTLRVPLVPTLVEANHTVYDEKNKNCALSIDQNQFTKPELGIATNYSPQLVVPIKSITPHTTALKDHPGCTKSFNTLAIKHTEPIILDKSLYSSLRETSTFNALSKFTKPLESQILFQKGTGVFKISQDCSSSLGVGSEMKDSETARVEIPQTKPDSIDERISVSSNDDNLALSESTIRIFPPNKNPSDYLEIYDSQKYLNKSDETECLTKSSFVGSEGMSNNTNVTKVYSKSMMNNDLDVETYESDLSNLKNTQGTNKELLEVSNHLDELVNSECESLKPVTTIENYNNLVHRTKNIKPISLPFWKKNRANKNNINKKFLNARYKSQRVQFGAVRTTKCDSPISDPFRHLHINRNPLQTKIWRNKYRKFSRKSSFQKEVKRSLIKKRKKDNCRDILHSGITETCSGSYAYDVFGNFHGASKKFDDIREPHKDKDSVYEIIKEVKKIYDFPKNVDGVGCACKYFNSNLDVSKSLDAIHDACNSDNFREETYKVGLKNVDTICDALKNVDTDPDACNTGNTFCEVGNNCGVYPKANTIREACNCDDISHDVPKDVDSFQDTFKEGSTISYDHLDTIPDHPMNNLVALKTKKSKNCSKFKSLRKIHNELTKNAFLPIENSGKKKPVSAQIISKSQTNAVIKNSLLTQSTKEPHIQELLQNLKLITTPQIRDIDGTSSMSLRNQNLSVAQNGIPNQLQYKNHKINDVSDPEKFINQHIGSTISGDATNEKLFFAEESSHFLNCKSTGILNSLSKISNKTRVSEILNKTKTPSYIDKNNKAITNSEVNVQKVSQNINTNPVNVPRQLLPKHKVLPDCYSSDIFTTMSMELDAISIAAVADMEENPFKAITNLIEVNKDIQLPNSTKTYHRALELMTSYGTFSKLSDCILGQINQIPNQNHMANQPNFKSEKPLNNAEEFIFTSFTDDCTMSQLTASSRPIKIPHTQTDTDIISAENPFNSKNETCSNSATTAPKNTNSPEDNVIKIEEKDVHDENDPSFSVEIPQNVKTPEVIASNRDIFTEVISNQAKTSSREIYAINQTDSSNQHQPNIHRSRGSYSLMNDMFSNQPDSNPFCSNISGNRPIPASNTQNFQNGLAQYSTLIQSVIPPPLSNPLFNTDKDTPQSYQNQFKSSLNTQNFPSRFIPNSALRYSIPKDTLASAPSRPQDSPFERLASTCSSENFTTPQTQRTSFDLIKQMLSKDYCPLNPTYLNSTSTVCSNSANITHPSQIPQTPSNSNHQGRLQDSFNPAYLNCTYVGQSNSLDSSSASLGNHFPMQDSSRIPVLEPCPQSFVHPGAYDNAKKIKEKSFTTKLERKYRHSLYKSAPQKSYNPSSYAATPVLNNVSLHKTSYPSPCGYDNTNSSSLNSSHTYSHHTYPQTYSGNALRKQVPVSNFSTHYCDYSHYPT